MGWRTVVNPWSCSISSAPSSLPQSPPSSSPSSSPSATFSAASPPSILYSTTVTPSRSTRAPSGTSAAALSTTHSDTRSAMPSSISTMRRLRRPTTCPPKKRVPFPIPMDQCNFLDLFFPLELLHIRLFRFCLCWWMNSLFSRNSALEMDNNHVYMLLLYSYTWWISNWELNSIKQ